MGFRRKEADRQEALYPADVIGALEFSGVPVGDDLVDKIYTETGRFVLRPDIQLIAEAIRDIRLAEQSTKPEKRTGQGRRVFWFVAATFFLPSCVNVGVNAVHDLPKVRAERVINNFFEPFIGLLSAIDIKDDYPKSVPTQSPTRSATPTKPALPTRSPLPTKASPPSDPTKLPTPTVPTNVRNTAQVTVPLTQETARQ